MKNWEYKGIIGFLIGIILLGFILLYIANNPPVSGMQEYNLSVEYFRHRRTENISLGTETVFEGQIFPIFMELENESIYTLYHAYEYYGIVRSDNIVHYIFEPIKTFLSDGEEFWWWVSFQRPGFVGVIRIDDPFNQTSVGAVYCLTGVINE